jgi:hypothetical protein
VVCHSKPTQCLIYAGKWLALALTSYGSSVADVVNPRFQTMNVWSNDPDDECLDFKPDIYRSPCWPSAPVGDHFVLRIKRRTGLLKKNWYIQRSCYYAISVASKMRKSCSSLLFLVTFQSAVSTSVFNHGAFQIRLIAINHHRRMPCPAAVHVSSAYWPVSCLSPAVRSSV